MPLKSLVTLWVTIACTFPETNKMSLARISTRAKSLEYLTVTLPRIGKVLDLSLAKGELQSFTGICSTYKGTRYPVPLREYFALIFDAEGYVYPVIPPTVIRKLRTLLYLFYKYEVPFTDQQLVDAHEKFINVDQSVKTVFTEDQCDAIRPLICDALNFDPMAVVGHHSNGATAGGFDNIQRREVFQVIPSLNRVYDLKFFFNSYNHFKWYKENYVIESLEPSSRVAFVPKDSRGPRTICIEPHCRMYIQQGLMRKIYDHLEHTHPFRGRINFTDQTINGRLALESSVHGQYATLDLQDASDLVSWELVKKVIPTEWVEPLTALRTPIASLPDGRQVELNKFAPMGSALCFPIEALIFFAICRTVTRDVYVYGDDIIVPTGQALECIIALEDYGLRVNHAKSFLYGRFRESCGVDAFDGENVTPIRYRRDNLVSIVAFANLMGEAFSDKTAEAVINWYESFVPVIIPRLPHSFKQSGAIALFVNTCFNKILYKRRWNSDLQRYECRFLSVINTRGKVAPDSWNILYDSLASREDQDFHELYSYISKEYREFKEPFDKRSDYGRFALSKDKVGYRWVPDYSQV